MARKGVIISRGAVGANVSGKPWQTVGLLTTGVAVSGGLTLGTVYKLTSVADAEDLGLNNDYDVDENVVIYQHIVDFYDDARNEGKSFYLLVVAQTNFIDDLVDVSSDNFAKKIIREANGEIYSLAVGFNPASGYTETATDGLNADVRAAIVKAQALWEWSLDNFMEVQIALEGRNITSTASSALDLRAIPASPSGIEYDDKVTIVIGQDWDFAETLSGLAQKYAGIGKWLGTRAAADLNQDIGEVESFNLTQTAKGRWVTAGLSNHVKVKDITTLDTYHTKQYVFADTYVGVSGYRWNGDYVCAPVVVDADGNMNEHTGSLGLTMNYASRRLRAQLLPEVRKVKPVDPATGKLSIGTIKYLEGKGNEVFEDMSSDGHIVVGQTIVDKDSPVQEEGEVNASFNLVAYSTIAQINGTINNKTRI